MNWTKIFIIRLANSSRSVDLISKLEKLNLDFTVIDAENGYGLQESQIKLMVDVGACYARLGYKISRGLIGCYLSHQKTYQSIVDEKLSWALVLEEDAKIIDLDFKSLEQLMELNFDRPTIIQLFTRSSRLIKKSTIDNLGENHKYVSFEFHRRIVGSGAAAYLINQKAARLALQNKIVRGAPDWPPWSTGVKFLGIYPWMFYEDSNGSMIINNKIKDYVYRLRRIQILLGLHYLVNRKYYDSFKAYVQEEILPYTLYLVWKIKGCKTYTKDVNSPQIF